MEARGACSVHGEEEADRAWGSTIVRGRGRGRDHLQGSGVFFALKIQSARNEAQLDLLVKEVENLRRGTETTTTQ